MVDKIIQIQDQDCAIRDIKKELNDIPARQKEEELRLEERKVTLGLSEDVLKSKQAAMKEVELEIASRNQRTTKLRQQQLDIKTNQEFKAIESEVLAIAQGISELEDKQLAVMEEIDSAKKDVAEKKNSLSEEESAIKRDKDVLGRRAEELKTTMQKMIQDRETAAKEIDPVWLERYERIFSRKDRAMVALENGICSGCHMKLPPAVIHSAGKHTDMVFCDYCGRLLY